MPDYIKLFRCYDCGKVLKRKSIPLGWMQRVMCPAGCSPSEWVFLFCDQCISRWDSADGYWTDAYRGKIDND